MNTVAPHWLMAFFVGSSLFALLIDFLLLRKEGAHVVSVKEALIWSVAWIGLSLSFNALLWWAVRDATDDVVEANTQAMAFLTAYLVEKSLAVDNIFVFLMIFNYFSVPPAYQKRVLVVGIIGAIVLRTIMILIGGWLVAEFHWVMYLFGAFLMVTGVKMWVTFGKKFNLDNNPGLRLLRRVVPVSDAFDGERLFTIQGGRRIGTPLLMVVAMVGFTDVIFAIDSIPAIFAITTDPFIVLSSNIFAILGLRAMFFLLATVAAKFHLLNYGLAVIMLFIGGKMLLIDVIHIPVLVSLGVVVTVLIATMAWSALTEPKSHKHETQAPLSH
jgi:tellurite resistance protein TerC